MTPEGFRELAEHLPLALVLLDPEGRVRVASPAAKELLGKELEGRELAELDRDPDRVRRYLDLCRRSAQTLPGTLHPRPAEAEALRCDGWSLAIRNHPRRHLMLRLRARPAAAERFVLLNRQVEELHREIKRRQEVERERELLLEQERQARQLADEASRLKDDFLATLSHELRTPLNAIKGWVGLLRMQPPAADVLERGLEVIERNTDAQTQLIEDLLDVSRIVGGRFRLSVRPIDLATVVSEALDTLEPATDAKGIAVRKVLGSDCRVHGDPDRLLQVVANLLSNAVKFTPKGGRIEVVLRRVDSRVELAVTDDGEGMAPETLEVVFERFRQADSSITRRHGGLGLGLAIVRHLVELHGGSVTATSPGLGRGSTFTVSLPVPLLDPPTVEPVGEGADAAAETVALAGLEILLVEDHEDSRGVLARVLEDAGARVVEATGAEEALAELARGRPDLVVSDLEMPTGDGYALIESLRAAEEREGRPRVPALAITAYAAAEHRVRALRAGYQSFLAKPVDPVELLAAVASLVDVRESGGS